MFVRATRVINYTEDIYGSLAGKDTSVPGRETETTYSRKIKNRIRTTIIYEYNEKGTCHMRGRAINVGFFLLYLGT